MGSEQGVLPARNGQSPPWAVDALLCAISRHHSLSVPKRSDLHERIPQTSILINTSPRTFSAHSRLGLPAPEARNLYLSSISNQHQISSTSSAAHLPYSAISAVSLAHSSRAVLGSGAPRGTSSLRQVNPQRQCDRICRPARAQRCSSFRCLTDT
jgi:hypothetical protein